MKSRVYRIVTAFGLASLLMFTAASPLLAQMDWVKVTPQYDPKELDSAWGSVADDPRPEIVALTPTSGIYAYCWGEEYCLTVIDITNPISPRWVARFDPSGWPYGLPVSTNFSYAPDAIEGWWVTDNSDPANPKPVGGYKSIAAVSGVHVSGQYAFVSEGDGRLAVINISDPASPQRVGEYRGTNDIAALVVVDKYAYAVARGHQDEESEEFWLGGGLQVIDISDAANPKRIGWCEYARPNGMMGKVAVAVRSSYAYVTESHPRKDDWQGMYLQVIDISNPGNMRRIGSCDFVAGCPGATSVTVSGNYAYVAYGAGGGCMCCAPFGVAVIDVSDPASPRRVGGCEIPFPHPAVDCGNLVVSGDQVYAALGCMVCPFVITELPAVTRQNIANGEFTIQWNEPAKGMKLQRTTSLANPDWQDLLGSENTNAVFLRIWGGSEFFRLAK